MQSNTQTASYKPFRSLRERCGIKFTLTFTPPYFKSTQPSYNNVPRRRKRTCVPPPVAEPLPSPPSPSPSPPPKPGKLGSQLNQFLRRRRIENYQAMVRRNTHPDFSPAVDDLDDLLATPYTPHFAECNESRCLQEIIPGCYVAFEDDRAAWFGCDSKDTLATPNGGGWTHVVSISQPPAEDLTASCSADSSDGSDSNTASTSNTSDTYDESIQTLRICLPPVPAVEAEDDDLHRSILTDAQIIGCRDFLSFHGHALQWPYPSDLVYSSSSSSSSSSTLAVDELPVRLLITAPRNRRADALSVAFCFLAFTFNTPVETFIRELHAQRRCLSVWKHVLDREGARRLDQLVEVSAI